MTFSSKPFQETKDGESEHELLSHLDPRLIFFIQRCDGVRPSCSQCVKAGREKFCDFDDRHRKSRTQILQEKLLSLEQKLRKLEDVPAESAQLEKVYQQALYPPPYASDDTHNQDTPMVDFPTLIFDTIAPSNYIAACESFDPDGSSGTFPVSISDFLQPFPPGRSFTPTESSTDNVYRNGFESQSSLYSSPQQGEIEFPAHHNKQEL